ncbi:MAG: hypothetical protein ACE5I1_16275 [bacterium]
MNTAIDNAQLKKIFKEAMLEVLEERKEFFYELLAEVVEDFALAKAIKEGEKTKSISRSEIFNILEARD